MSGGGKNLCLSVTSIPACQEHGAGLCLAVPSNSTRGGGEKLMPRKFRLDLWMNFFPVRVPEHWNSVESPSLGAFQNGLDTIQYLVLRDGPAFGVEVGPDDPTVFPSA